MLQMKKNHITNLKSVLRTVLMPRPVVSCGLLPCEDCPAGGEESDVGFKEPCQLPELVNYWGWMEGVLEVPDHKLLHMESF